MATPSANPLPAAEVNAMAGSAHQLPPGTSAERRAALTDPEREPEAEP